MSTAEQALRRIVRLDFEKTAVGGDDFYSGATMFIRAWLIAFRALARIQREGTK